MNGRKWVGYLYCGEEGVEDGYGGEEAGQRGEAQGAEQQLGGALVLQAVHTVTQHVALLAPTDRGAGRQGGTGHHRQSAINRSIRGACSCEQAAAAAGLVPLLLDAWSPHHDHPSSCLVVTYLKRCHSECSSDSSR